MQELVKGLTARERFEAVPYWAPGVSVWKGRAELPSDVGLTRAHLTIERALAIPYSLTEAGRTFRGTVGQTKKGNGP